jgi:hypothetical protein
MPQSTDLVTDLPADFEVFGQAVATSMADLLGGTTGQILSKASNTDMDFTWVAQDDSNAIQNAIVDAKGDLIAATAADTPARLAVGTNGQVLTADSTAATGLAWAAIPAPTYTWATYTPTNTGLTLGNGTQTARYVKVGKTVFVSYRLVFGSTTSMPAGLNIGLPSTANSYSTCSVYLEDSGVGASLGTGVCFASNSVAIRPINSSGTYATWNNDLSAVFTWSTNDNISFFITYEEA